MAGEGFEEIFEIKSKEEFAKNPVSLTGYLIDKRFPREDISTYRTIARFCPSVISKVLRGDSSPEEAAKLAAKQSKVDEGTARSLFERMCGKADVIREVPTPLAEPAPVEEKPAPVPIREEPVPPGLVLKVEGSEAVVLRYVGDAANVRIPSLFKGCRVTSIAEQAFKELRDLKSVDVPATVKVIGKEAFFLC